MSQADRMDAKAALRHYLQQGREALLWKLDGLSDYDGRRPLVPTGTNVLGVVKHVAGTEAGYLGDVFGRPFPQPLPWMSDDAEPNADLWATATETRDEIVALYRRVWVHSDATIETLDLEAPGRVPWWPPDSRDVTLHRICLHMIAETHRHAGQVDVVRELIDGAAGHRAGVSNLPEGDQRWWSGYRDRLESVAREVGGVS